MNLKEAGWSLLSGVLLAASFAPWEPVWLPLVGAAPRSQWALLAWIAWVPLLSRLLPIGAQAPCKRPFRAGFLMGIAFWLGTISWLWHVTIPGMLALAIYLSLFMGAWSSGMSRLYARWPRVTGSTHVFLSAMGAAGWVALEWLRGWLLGGFPWNFAAVTQHQNLALIQIAEWTGVYGISFVLVFVNLSLWLTWRRLKMERFSAKNWRYEFSVAILLVAFCLMFGMRRLLFEQQTAVDAVTHRIALIQPNIRQEVKYEAVSFSEQLDRLRRLTLEAAAAKPDLIIWPETALVMGPTFKPENRLWLEALVETIKIPILFGTIDAPPWALEGDKRWKPRWWCNSAMLIDETGKLGAPYHKLHLVPFGEYVPFENWLPWLRRLTPIQTSFEPGKGAVYFDLKGSRIGPLICFEDTFPSLARNLSRGSADILVNFTNDAWFKESPGAAIHMANAVFRAIENRRPLVRCSNSGVTCVIGPMGQVLQVQQPFVEGSLFSKIMYRRNRPNTFYCRYGDWFSFSCGLVFVMAGVGCLWKPDLQTNFK